MSVRTGRSITSAMLPVVIRPNTSLLPRYRMMSVAVTIPKSTVSR